MRKSKIKIREKVKKEAKEIALKRVKKLFCLAKKRIEEGEEEYARKYIKLAKRLAMKAQVKIPKELKKSYCKSCFLLLIPNKTCKIRILNKKVVKICLRCGRKRVVN